MHATPILRHVELVNTTVPSLVLDKTNNQLFVVERDANSVQPVELDPFTPDLPVEVGSAPYGAALFDGVVYVGNFDNGTVPPLHPASILCYNMTVAEKIVATNRKAYHDYFIEDTIEAGLVLTGSEIKSVREGRVNLRDGYARITNGEMWMSNVHISPYEHSGRSNLDPIRDRKLLLHKAEILRLASRLQTKGLTLIPLRIYLRDGRAKVEVGLAKGKRQYDKREAIAERDAERDMERELAG